MAIRPGLPMRNRATRHYAIESKKMPCRDREGIMMHGYGGRVPGEREQLVAAWVAYE